MEKFYEKTRALLKEYGVTDDEAENFIKDLIEIIDKDKDGYVSDDVAEAKEEIAEKGKDSQSEKDRIDESVGEKLEEEGDEDEQTAKDRVDESEGEELITPRYKQILDLYKGAAYTTM